MATAYDHIIDSAIKQLEAAKASKTGSQYQDAIVEVMADLLGGTVEHVADQIGAINTFDREDFVINCSAEIDNLEEGGPDMNAEHRLGAHNTLEAA